MNHSYKLLSYTWQIGLMLFLFLASPGPVMAEDNTVKQVGEASWYGPGFHGKETKSGETFNQNKLTAAHPELPMGTEAEVTNLENGKSVEVKINDRGPHVDGRVIDLSKAAAKKIDMVEEGTTPVKIEAELPADASQKSSTGDSQTKEPTLQEAEKKE